MSKLDAAIARSRARDGYAIPVGTRRPAPHLVTIEKIVGPESIAYQWKCSSCVGCGTESTENEARQRAFTHVGGGVRIAGGRPEFKFEILVPRKAAR